MKRFLLYFFSIGILIFPCYAEKLIVPENARESEELVQLSNWLCQLQQGLHKVSEIDTIWIGGGSARAVLDHLYFEKPLVMRDLDIFVVANDEVTDAFVEKIGEHMDGKNFGFFSRKDLRNRPRVPSDKPVLTRNQYVAGYGLHWIRPNGEILDLSVYHSKKDLDLNGIFDIDTIMIPLDLKESLYDFAKRAKEISYEELVDQGRVYDRYAGYRKWLAGEINIVNWLDIEADPLLKILRVVRTIFKGRSTGLTEEESVNFRYLLQDAKIANPLQMTRSLLKVLEDEAALQELKLLKEVGLFDHWLTEFKELDFAQIDLQKAKPLSYGRGEHAALGRLYYLVGQLPESQSRLEAIFTTMSSFDQSTLATWMYSELFGSEKIFEEIPQLSNSHLEKICKSSVLPHEQKKELFRRELKNEWVPRKGVITGVFNPVHLGHMEFFQEAQREMVLDELIIVVLENSDALYETIDWKDRFAMVKLLEKEYEGLKVLGPEYHELLKTEEEHLVEILIKEDPGIEWVRVLGSDMMQNYCESGKQKREACNQVLVIQRGEISSYPSEENSDSKIIFKVHEPDASSHQKSHQSKNARKLARQGQDTSEFVPASVAEYIKTHDLYRERAPIYCLTTNASKFKVAKKLFPHCEQISMDLPLVHLVSPEESVKEKLQKAMMLGKSPLFVIDQFIKIKAVSDHFIPLSDFTLQSLGVQNIAKLIQTNGNNEATLWTIVGYVDAENHIQLFQERIKGILDPENLNTSHYFDANSQLASAEKENYLERVLRRLKEEKIGIMTGVFNPMHLGHIEALQKVKRELGLDRVIVIPTPGTHHNEEPIAWEQRMEMARLATQTLDEIEIVPSNYKSLLQQGTGKALNHLMASYPNATFWHIMGSDSFERFVDRGHITDLSSRYRIAVIERAGHLTPITDSPLVAHFSSNNEVGNQERASSKIRSLLREHKSISCLVPAPVASYIKKNALYEIETKMIE